MSSYFELNTDLISEIKIDIAMFSRKIVYQKLD